MSPESQESIFRRMCYEFFNRGNSCILSYKSSCKIIEEFPNLPSPIGKKLQTDSLFVLRLANGKVA